MVKEANYVELFQDIQSTIDKLGVFDLWLWRHRQLPQFCRSVRPSRYTLVYLDGETEEERSIMIGSIYA